MVVGDLGFRAVFALVFVAIGLFIRRKWRLAEARREEIRILLAMASEEAARAEFEATIQYAASSTAAKAPVHPVPSTTPQRYCAVCYSPTTSRCRRCKSVRYCSSKCQVIHWRQGHKHECSPSLATSGVKDEGSNLASELAEENNHGDESTTKSVEDESEYESDSSTVVAPNSPRKDDIRSDLIPDDNILVPENSSVFPPSPVSSSSAAHKVFGDFNGSKDVLQGISNPAVSRDPSASVVELDNNVSQSSTAKSDSQCISTSASDSDENTMLAPSAASSGFWDGYLEPSIINKTAQAGSLNMGNDGLVDKNAPKLRSLSDVHIKGSESSNPCQTVRPKMVTTLSGKEATHSLSSSASVFLTADGTNGRKSKEVKQLSSRASFDNTPVVKVHTVAANSSKESYDSGRSKHINASITESSQLSKSKMVETPKYMSRSRSHSDANKQSTSTLKPVQADNVPSRVKVNQPRQPKLSKYYSFGVGSGPSAQNKLNNDKVLFSYELFVKLYNWKEVELRPSGLINCGNSCYANAVLQCLTYTPPLTAYLLQALHSKTCRKRDWCFTCEIERLTIATEKAGAPLSPISILSRIEKIGSHLSNGREEDAHEFMRYAIETMQSICLQEAGVSGSRRSEEETTLLGLTFGGYLRSKIRCMRCRGKSEQHERIMDLTVEIEGNIETLEEALRKFTGVEILDGENKYQCSRCKSYEKAKKRLSIYEAPNVLTIALKRFQAGKFGKLNKSISFPDVLDLAPYMRGSSERSPIYSLYGVIVHLDVMNATFSGHYICYVRNAQNKWFKIDDSMVKAVEKESVLKEGAYMLFYSRYSPRAPRSIRDSVVSHDILGKGKPPEFRSSPKGGIDGLRGGGQYEKMGFCNEESSSESSIFSRSEEGASSTTDSNQESSTSTDDLLLDHFLGEEEGLNNNWRKPLDSDTSSSSSTSSSPLYMPRPSPLSETQRYASAHSGGGATMEVPVLQSDRNLVNSSGSSYSGKLVGSSSKSNTPNSLRPGVYLR